MPTDSPVTPEPIYAEVVCEDCGGTGMEADQDANGHRVVVPRGKRGHRPCWQCDGDGWVGRHLSPSSLAARYIELGRAAVRFYTQYPMQIAETTQDVVSHLHAVRSHLDFRPDQKEGTHDGE